MVKPKIEWLNDIELPYLRDRAIRNYHNFNDYIHKDNAISIHQSINSFVWSGTPEGAVFWNRIFDYYDNINYFGIKHKHEDIKIGDVYIDTEGVRYYIILTSKEKLLEDLVIRLIKEGDFTNRCISTYYLNDFLILLDKGNFKHGEEKEY